MIIGTMAFRISGRFVFCDRICSNTAVQSLGRILFWQEPIGGILSGHLDTDNTHPYNLRFLVPHFFVVQKYEEKSKTEIYDTRNAISLSIINDD